MVKERMTMAEERVLSFKPSSINELNTWNFKLGDKFEIEFETIDACSGILDIVKTEAYIVNVSFSHSYFDVAFCYVNQDGLDGWCILERAKIIRKIN